MTSGSIRSVARQFVRRSAAPGTGSGPGLPALPGAHRPTDSTG